MIYLQVIFLFILGISIGSFLNVLIDRIPKGISPIHGRSKCDFCHKVLSWYDLIPLLSFFLLQGQCRYCRKKISWQYPLVETISGMILVANYFFNYSNWWMIFFNYLLLSGFLVIFITDLKYKIIPDQLNIFLVILIVINLILKGTSFEEFFSVFLSGVTIFIFFLLLFLLTKGRGMGLGDVKFSFLMGLLLGFPKILVAFYLAFLTGAVISLILIIRGKKTMKSKIAFGPFLVSATVISFFFGNQIFDMVKNLFAL